MNGHFLDNIVSQYFDFSVFIFFFVPEKTSYDVFRKNRKRYSKENPRAGTRIIIIECLGNVAAIRPYCKRIVLETLRDFRIVFDRTGLAAETNSFGDVVLLARFDLIRSRQTMWRPNIDNESRIVNEFRLGRSKDCRNFNRFRAIGKRTIYITVSVADSDRLIFVANTSVFIYVIA